MHNVAKTKCVGCHAKGTLSCRSDNCSLCEEIVGQGHALHMDYIPDAPPHRILHESKNWVVLPTIGPLARGHLMLVPRQHHYSILEAASDVLEEGQQLLTVVVAKLARIYKRPVLVFEHGATPNEEGICGACVDHAHLHVIPGPLSFIPTTMSLLDGWRNSQSFIDLRPSPDKFSYQLIGQWFPENQLFMRRCSERVPSQFLRKILAEHLGRPKKWNWKYWPSEDLFLKTIQDWVCDKQLSETAPALNLNSSVAEESLVPRT